MSKISQLQQEIYDLEKSVLVAPTPEDRHDLAVKKDQLECHYCRRNGAGVCEDKRKGYICPVRKRLRS